jgi:hypothetical protein
MPRPAYPNYRPSINAKLRNLPFTTEAAIRAFGVYNTPPFFFDYCGEKVRLDIAEDGSFRFVQLDVYVLRQALSEAAVWFSREDEPCPELPPLDVVRNMLASPDFLLPKLVRIARTPMLLKDKRLLLHRGYDVDSQIYYLPTRELASDLECLQGLENPTRDQANAALAELLDVFVDFPFDARSSRAHTLALLLTPFLRTYIDGPTPLFLIDKPEPGTGATLLASAALAIYLGHAPRITTLPEDDSEVRRTLTALLRSGVDLVMLDNLAPELRSRALSAALTSLKAQDRIVGSSSLTQVDSQCTWVGTGNNVIPSRELARRIAMIRLDARSARPDTRQAFKYANLLPHVLQLRSLLVSCCITIIRYWVCVGCPSGGRSMAGFEQWSDVVGGILGTIGVEGFLENREELFDRSKEEADEWDWILLCWWECLGDKVVTSKDICEAVTSSDHGGPSPRSPHALGIILASLVDRVRDGLVVRKTSSAKGKSHWRLERVEQARVTDSSPSSPSRVPASPAPIEESE